MKLLNCLTLLLCMFSSTAKCQECTEANEISLGEIYKSLAGISVPSPAVVRREKFSDFDFYEFRPSNSEIREGDYFNVGYDEKSRIVLIEHSEIYTRLGNFRMYVHNFQNYRIMLFLKKDDDGSYLYMPYLFVTGLKSKKSFVINMLPQFGDNPMANSEFDDSSAPIGTIQQLSAIIFLRNDFYPEYLIRIHEGKIIMASKFEYLQGTEVIDTEKLFLFTPSNGNSDVPVVNKYTCLEDLSKIFDRCCVFNLTVEPNINPTYKHVPLWYWGGAHFYK